MNITNEYNTKTKNEINYLLATINKVRKNQGEQNPNPPDPPDHENQFTPEQVIKLLKLLDRIDELEELGVSVSELKSQIEYLNDIIEFNAIQEYLIEKYGSQAIGTHYNLYMFRYNGRANALTYIAKPKIKDQFISKQKLFRQGFITIECKPEQMKAEKSNTLLLTNTKDSSWQVNLQDTSVEIKINDNISGEKSIIQVPFDTLSQGNETREVIEYDTYFLYFSMNDAITVLKSFSMNVNLKDRNVDLVQTVPTLVRTSIWETILANVPFGITIWNLGFDTNQGNEFLTIENLMAVQKLNKFDFGLQAQYQSINQSSNMVNALYGQTIAVSLSQLEAQLLSAVRKVKAEYSYSVTKAIVQTLLPDASRLPNCKSVIDKDWVRHLNTVDLFGNNFVTVYVRSNSLSGTTLWGPLKSKVYDRIFTQNYIESGANYITDFDLPMFRVSQPKTIVDQYIESKTNKTESWFEMSDGQPTFKSVVPYTCIITKAGYRYNVTLSSMIRQTINPTTKLTASLNIMGWRIFVEGTGLTYEELTSDVELVIGWKMIYQVNSVLSYVIAPTNITAEGSPDNIIGDVSYLLNSQAKTKRAVFTKNQIQYGTSQRTVYTAPLETISKEVVYVMGKTGPVKFGNANARASTSKFVGRDGEGFGVSLVTSIELDVYKPKWNHNSKSRPYVISTTENGQATASPREEIGREQYVAKCLFPFVGKFTDQIEPMMYPMMRSYNPDKSISYHVDQTKITHEMAIAFGSQDGYVGDNRSMMWTQGPVSIQYIADIAPGDVSPTLTSEGFEETQIYVNGAFKKMVEFLRVRDLKYSVNGSAGVIWNEETQKVTMRQANTREELDNNGYKISLVELNLSVEDLLFPGTISNQINIAETIVNLQTAVRMLEYYSQYLTILLDDTRQRLDYVEQTLNEIVDVLNSMLQSNQGLLGRTGSIIGFLGNGIGMFFPLVGLAVNLIGGVIKSVDTITNGDIVTGSLDLVIGGILTSLGVYKWSKRIRNKYGENDYLNEPINSSKENQPGYNIISLTPQLLKNKKTHSNGLFGNTDCQYETMQNDQNEAKIKSITLTTKMTRQAPLWSIIEWDPDVDRVTFQSVIISKRETSVRNEDIDEFDITEKYIAKIYVDIDTNEIVHQKLTANEIKNLFDVNAVTEDIALLDYVYYNSYEKMAYKNGIDDDIVSFLHTANGYTAGIDQQLRRTYNSKDYFNNFSSSVKQWKITSSLLKQSDSDINDITNLQKRDFKLLHSISDAYLPLIGITDYYAGLHPNVQSIDSQTLLFNNVFSLLVGDYR